MRAVALIIDIVKSRELVDRERAQKEVLAVFATVQEHSRFIRPVWPTVGDEFQAVTADVGQALRATALAWLTFPKHIDCRFGLGEGTMTVVGEGASGAIYDGSAWWSAREAVDEAKQRATRGSTYLRTWYVAGGESSGKRRAALVNSYLLMRDRVISAMNERERRLTAGVLRGHLQSELAEQEGITQSAVSQNLHRSGGAALLAAHQVLADAVAT